MKNKRIFGLAAALIGLLLITAGCHPFRSHSPEKMADYAVEKLTDKLDLSTEQVAKVEVLKTEVLAKHNEMKGNRGQHMDLFLAEFPKDTLDTAKLEAQMTAKDAQRVEHRKFMVEKLKEFHAILTPEQRTKLVELAKEYREKMGRHHWGGHHGMF